MERLSGRKTGLKTEIDNIITAVEEIGPTERNNNYPQTKFQIAESFAQILEQVRNDHDPLKALERRINRAKALARQYKKENHFGT